MMDYKEVLKYATGAGATALALLIAAVGKFYLSKKKQKSEIDGEWYDRQDTRILKLEGIVEDLYKRNSVLERENGEFKGQIKGLITTIASLQEATRKVVRNEIASQTAQTAVAEVKEQIAEALKPNGH